jgi:membrane-bound lytic murein transglycosylase F
MPKDWGSMSTKNEIESQLLRSPLDLAGKTVHVTRGLHSAKVLEHLSEEIGDTIYVVECDTLNPVELMRLVNEGQIDYTVVDEYIARMASYNLNSVDTKLAISLEQPIGWAIKQQNNDTSLLKALNDWIDNAEQKHLRKVMLRYVKNGKYISSRREESNKRLSSFDNSIKKTAKKIGWDWRLLAALIYQESRFKVDLESEKGAFGLMQLMPSVMKRYGIDYDSSVEEQLDAGGKLISYLDKSLKNKVVDSLERVKFILAAYNAGLGHVYDAQRLAQKYGKAPDLWDDNVDYYILNKSKYLNDTCCKSGFLRGTQTYRFVEEIMDRYHHYQALLD